VCLAGLLALAGCGGAAKLNVSKSYDMDAGEAKSIDLNPEKTAQKINVEFTSSAADVSVLLFKDADVKTDDDLTSAEAGKALNKEKGKAGSFTVDLPANTGARVVVRDAAKKTKVDVKVTNK
jgi:hypothetical protein